MKTFTIAIVSALLIASTFQACCSDCTAAAEASVTGTVLSAVSTTLPAADHMCNAHWNAVDGTCCDAAKVTEYWTAFKAEIETFRDAIKGEISGADIPSIKSSVTLAHTAVAGNLIPALSGVDANIKAAAVADLALAKDSLPIVEDLNAKITECYDAYIAFRKETLCHRCSGKASEWWNSADSTYLINHKSCNGLVAKCSVVFALTTVATRTLSSIRALFVAAHGATGLQGNETVNYNGEVSAAQAKKIVDCANKPDECVSDQSTKIEICGKFTVNHSNPDLEGDYSTLKDGFNILSNQSYLTSGFPSRLLLEGIRALTEMGNVANRAMTAATNKGYIAPQAEGGMTVTAGEYSFICKIGFTLIAFIAAFLN